MASTGDPRSEQRIVIYSYSRALTQYEGRLHQIDGWRIPIPGGLPYRGLGYLAFSYAVSIALSLIPGVSILWGQLHPAMRLLAVPIGLAVLLTQLKPDGRTVAAAAWAWAAHLLVARVLVGFRAARDDVLVVDRVTFTPDAGVPFYRRARIRPAASTRLLLRRPARATARGHRLAVKPIDGPTLRTAKELALAPDQTVTFT